MASMLVDVREAQVRLLHDPISSENTVKKRLSFDEDCGILTR